jgi:hypothetical protein
MNYEKITDNTVVGNKYSNLGVFYSSDVRAYKEAHLGGHGYFSDEPSCPNAITHPVSPSFVINIPGTVNISAVIKIHTLFI